MVTKIEEAQDQMWRAAIRFVRGAVASGLVTLGGYLIANSFDFSNWKQYTVAALVALGTGCLQGVSKFVRDEFGIDLKII